jgi:hypothetical protein
VVRVMSGTGLAGIAMLGPRCFIRVCGLRGRLREDDDDAPGPLMLADSPVRRRPRGRPASTLNFLARFVEPPVGPIIADHRTDTLNSFVRTNIGAFIHRAVSTAIVRGDARALDGDYPGLFAEYFSDAPHHCMSVSAEAKLLGIDRTSLPDRTIALASAVHFGTRAFIASLVSHLRVEFLQRRMKPVAVALWLTADETSMPTNNQEWHF